MSLEINSSNYYNQSANVTLYHPTGNTVTYINATQTTLGTQTIPYSYTGSPETLEYGVFSFNFTGSSKTCIINQQTPPDGDGNRYKIIKIGNQVWMSENLRTKKFQDGTPLSNSAEVINPTWTVANGPTTKYWALVNGITANTQTYGLVYNQFAVTGSTTGATANNNLCPSGYHVPTTAEFATLNTGLGGGGTVGTQMKSTTLWSSSGNGTNSSGFNGLPPGFRVTGGSWASFSNVGYFWTTSSGSNWDLVYNNATFFQDPNSSLNGFSVRCLRN